MFVPFGVYHSFGLEHEKGDLVLAELQTYSVNSSMWNTFEKFLSRPHKVNERWVVGSDFDKVNLVGIVGMNTKFV